MEQVGTGKVGGYWEGEVHTVTEIMRCRGTLRHGHRCVHYVVYCFLSACGPLCVCLLTML